MAPLKNILAPQARFGQNLPALAGGMLPAYVLAFLLGVFGYFQLPVEPPLGQIAPVFMVFVLLGMVALRNYWHVFLLAMWLAMCVGGVGYTAWRTQNTHTPFWPENQQQPVWLTGKVESLNAKASGFTTVTVRNVETINRQGKVQQWPGVIVSAHNSRFEEATQGADIAAQVKLSPPAKPLHPAMYNWQRRSFFEGISATGLVMGDLYITPPAEAPWRSRLNAYRQEVFQNITQTKHKGAGVGAALLTGLRGAIPPHVAENYRRSGLAHLMAISGMHLGMLSGAVYFLLLFVLVRCGKLPYRTDVRKWAAFGALLAAGGYSLMAGATVPTVRAFFLIVAAFFGLLSGRIHLGVRVLALVALGVVLYRPYLLLTASFQLSFVAALALVVWAYVRQTQTINLGALTPRPNRVLQMVQVSIVASLATLPLIALHFKQVAVVGVLANIVAIPLMAFTVLPLGFAYLLLGNIVGQWLLNAYLTMVDVLNYVAGSMAQLPMASFTINPQAVPFLWVVAVALLLAFLFKRWALVAIAAVALIPLVAAQQIEGPVAMVLNGGHNIIVSNGHDYKQLQETDDFSDKAFENLVKVLPHPQPTPLACDGHTCRYVAPAGALLVAASTAQLNEEDCLLNNWVIVPAFAHFSCAQGAKVYTFDKVTEVKFTPTQIELKTYPNYLAAPRPWNKQ